MTATMMVEAVSVTAKDRYGYQRSYATTHIDLGDGPLCGFHRDGMVLYPAFDATCDKCRVQLRKKVKVAA